MVINQSLWLSKNWTKWIFRLSLVGVGLGVAIAFTYLSYAMPPLRQVKISEVITLPSAATAQVDDQNVEKGSSITSGQQLITPSSARVGIQEATGAARLATHSSLILRNDCFQLGTGKAVIANSQGCIGAIVVSSTNGIYTIERLGYLAEVKVLAGKVDLSIPSNPAVGAVSLQPNQKVTVNWTGDEIGPVRLMLPQEVSAIANGELFQGFQVALPNQNKIAALHPPVSMVPAPQPAAPVKPTPAPVTPHPPIAQPPTDPQLTPASARAADYFTEDSYNSHDSHDSEPVDPSHYSRYVRRRPPTKPDERYSSRRRVRSRYASNSYRRRPAYSEPSYRDSSSGSSHEETYTPSAPPVMEPPHPVESVALPLMEAPISPAIEVPVNPLPVVPEGSVVVPVY